MPKPRPTDHVFDFDGVQVFVDPKSMVYLDGMTLDWKESLMQSGLCLRKSARQEELRLRHVVFGLMPLICWQCGGVTGDFVLRHCNRCSLRRRLLPLFGLPKALLDVNDLQSRFYAAQPPAASGPLYAPERARSGSTRWTPSSMLNDGYRTLRDPVSRAEYLLKQEGFDIGEQNSKDVPPELLEEVFEFNMALEEMREGDQSLGSNSRRRGSSFCNAASEIDVEPRVAVRRLRRDSGSSSALQRSAAF